MHDESLQERVARLTAEPVEVVAYDPRWPEAFEREKQHLLEVVPAGIIRRIEHFGSTAVPGLAAKPVIDMLVEVSSLDEVRSRVVSVLEAEGYEYLWRPTSGDDGPPFYGWFIKRDRATGRRTHHIHMVEAGFKTHWDRLLFRDYLRAHADAAEEYASLKRSLAEEHPGDRVAYTRAKTEFIERTTAAAAAGRQSSPARFFITTFAASWLLWIPLALVRLGVLDAPIPASALAALALPGVLMPGICGLALMRTTGGRGAALLLRRAVVRWRVGTGPWIFVLLLQPMLLAAVAALYNASEPSAPVRLVSGLTPASLGVSLAFLLLASTGEEVGWRGIALPALQRTQSPLRASVVLGLAVATWHLPYWVLLGTLEQYGWAYFAVDYLFVVALTFQLTWLFNRSHGSIMLPVAFHLVFNLVNVAILPVTAGTGPFLLLTAAEWAVALVMLRHLDLPEANTDAVC